MFFVTGGTGFIGKYVVKKLIKNQKKVIVLVRNSHNYHAQGDETVIEGTLNKPELWENALKDYTINTCIHLAWEGIPDYSYEMSKKNLLYGLRVLDICKEFRIPNLVITGSCWEYDTPCGSISVKSPTSQENPFKASKNSLRIMAHLFCLENKIHFNWLRLFYVYGPGQREGSLIPYIIQCFKQRKQPKLSGAYNRNDFIYVTDVADAIIKVSCNHIYPEILNIGNGKSIQVLSVVKIVARDLGYTLDENAFSNSMNSVDFYADQMEMYKDFSWKPTVTIEQGIKYMIEAAKG